MSAVRQRMKSRLWLVILGAIALVYLIVWVLGLLRTPESPASVAARIEQAILAGDAETIFRYLSEEEKDVLELDEADVGRYLDEFILPMLQGFDPVGEPSANSGTDDGTVSRSQLMQHPDGRAFRLLTQASPAGDEDARVVAFVANTYLALSNARLEPGQSPPTGRAKREKWIADAEALGPKLAGMGIPGFYTIGLETYSWESWAEWNRDALKGVRR